MNNSLKSQMFLKEVNNEYKLTENGERIINEKSRGYISYLRGENPYTFPTKLYPLDAKVIQKI